MKNIIQHSFNINKADRNKMNDHLSFVIWFTGLSGSGKSTLANLVEKELFNQNIRTFALDGDNIRSGINKDLQFTPEEREENLRRVAEISKLFINSGNVVIASFISPLRKDREYVKKIIGEENFIEVFVNTSLQECERRDVKGLYDKARKGEIKNFTGIDAPYEAPEAPDFEVKTELEDLEKAVKRIVGQLQKKLEI
ncbi:adenylyl-sulfate kinase [Autumnicola psychrophila]|uniref:Adenylyl-sulfate kinase n=1 Tax=Autumnicola psychrophila TaxID=3075592 RepID=A0ABU3DS92_9FLAO|nr:adenylyl-sulfate kinase [Zunongwangia sp. F225]MDT0686591.1 adenylyl-sulfate kinase [Zunongwangia sp. F225]